MYVLLEIVARQCLLLTWRGRSCGEGMEEVDGGGEQMASGDLESTELVTQLKLYEHIHVGDLFTSSHRSK